MRKKSQDPQVQPFRHSGPYKNWHPTPRSLEGEIVLGKFLAWLEPCKKCAPISLFSTSKGFSLSVPRSPALLTPSVLQRKGLYFKKSQQFTVPTNLLDTWRLPGRAQHETPRAIKKHPMFKCDTQTFRDTPTEKVGP